jgi:hypothetical protein
MGVQPHPLPTKVITNRVLKGSGKAVREYRGLNDQRQKRAHNDAEYESPHSSTFSNSDPASTQHRNE